MVLATGAIAATFALLTRSLIRRLNDSTALVFVAAALALTVPHLLARPHVLAMPVMVMWVSGLIAAADRRGAPSFWLLPLMALWANLHGGFVFGLFLIAPIGARCGGRRSAKLRKSLVLRWALFAVLALAASCCTPYGWNALLASRKILELGSALPLIMEWKPTEFGGLGAFEICLLLGIGLSLLRGIKLPPTRILLLLGLVAHGVRAGPRGRNPGAAGAAGAGRPAGAANRRQRRVSLERDAGARRAVRQRCGRDGRWHGGVFLGASL